MKKLELTEEEMRKRKLTQRSDAQRRWRERNPDAVKRRSKIYRARALEKHPEKIAATAAKSRAKRKDKKKIENAEYRKANRVQIAAYMKEWTVKNKDVITAKRKAFYEANRERLLAEKKSEYIAKHEEIRASRKEQRPVQRRNEEKRRALKAGATVGDPRIITEWENRWRSKPLVKCYWCRCKIKPCDAHRDHIQPISKLGAHSIENLVIACGPCNMQKHARELPKWNESLAQPVLL